MKFFLFIIMSFCFFSCKSQENDNYIYMLSYNTNCNFSIFINDFLIYENNNIQGSQGGMIELNPFIPNSSTQNLKIILKNENGNIPSTELSKQNFQLIRAKIPLEENRFEEIDKAKFVFLPKQNIISIVEFKPILSYDSKEINLNQSKDLSKIDKTELSDKVLAFYENYGEIDAIFLLTDGLPAARDRTTESLQKEIVKYIQKKVSDKITTKIITIAIGYPPTSSQEYIDIYKYLHQISDLTGGQYLGR